MWNKLLIAGVAGAALVAVGSTSAYAQNSCEDVQTVSDVLGQDFSCTLLDKEFSNFSFDQFILDQADDVDFVIDVEFLIGGDVFSVSLGELSDEQGESFGWSYTIEITPAGQAAGNQFAAVGLTLETGAFGTDAEITKDFQGFDNGNQLVDDSLFADDNTSSVTTGLPDGITRIDVQDEVTVGANGTFNGASNEFQQEFSRVPLPATLGLFGVGLVAMGYSVRRKRS